MELTQEEVYQRFGKKKVVELTLQYVPYFCFDYHCELHNEKGAFEENKEGRIAVNGLTGACEEWSGDVQTEEENTTGGMKVRAQFRVAGMDRRVRDAIITTNTLEDGHRNGSQHWLTPLASSVRYSYTGVFYFPFYNVALHDKNVIVDATTGAEEG